MAWSTKSFFKQTKMNLLKGILSAFSFLILIVSCNSPQVETIRIGYIGPLSKRAIDMGIPQSRAYQLAVDEYNSNRQDNEPQVELFIEDDQWEKDQALPLYEKLRKEHQIDVLFMSNTDGVLELQDKIMEDHVILIQGLNSDDLLSSLNRNTFKIAKRTEEANGIIGRRIVELGLKKILILYFPNDFMTRGTKAIQSVLDENQVETTSIEVTKGDTNFIDILQKAKDYGYDGYVFMGYREFGYAMKQARALGIEAPYFASTTLMDPEYFNNSNGKIIGTEFTFFTELDGNYVLAHEFLESFKNKYDSPPKSIWTAMQAYDAMNILLSGIKTINSKKAEEEEMDAYLRKSLHGVTYHQGVCGNLSIGPDGASKGIYFSVYQYSEKGKATKIKR